MRRTRILGVAVVVVLAAAALLAWPQAADQYAVSATGMVTYSLQNPAFTVTPLPDGSQEIVFTSRDWPVHGIYAAPATPGVHPAFVVLPGGNVRKEDEHRGLARDLRDLGFATLTLDQRGIGATGGPFPPLEDQFTAFANRNEPEYHKMVADAIAAARVLAALPDVDPDAVFIAGVSMGGRVAIIAAAQDKGIGGVLAVSTGGFPAVAGLPAEQERFLASINPDAYVASLAPRPLVMIHAEQDPVIPLTAAEQTYALARQPKEFFSVLDAGHGYYTDRDRFFLEQSVATWTAPGAGL
ncbi:MAG: alpha/beta fold hydrolase [Candidatus Aenigmarchaeota archaeon]|nr:alpha/beta fold hydrolase [Candidatus Aenigmarchaeota archaeon]